METKKGLECLACANVVTEDEDPDLDETAPCEECDGTAFQPVEISECSWTEAAACPDDDHHWGRGDHVRTVER